MKAEPAEPTTSPEPTPDKPGAPLWLTVRDGSAAVQQSRMRQARSQNSPLREQPVTAAAVFSGHS